MPSDPGPRGGPPDAGGPFPTLGLTERRFFNQARGVFEEIDSVQGTLPGEPGKGLGPVFNGNSCAMCHAQPAPGGTSPGLTSKQNPMPNPQVPLATLDGALNVVPSFITTAGPVREPRFIRTATSNIAPNDGSVHEIYSIRGRVDAPGCELAQPDFEAEIAASNVIFRIPTPIFGAGLVENVSELTLMQNLEATAARRAALGIAGEFNRSGNDQSITRFGWKAQNKSLEIFAGEAYLIEQGVSNELFQNERIPLTMGGTAVPPSCVFNPTPEDFTQVTTATLNPVPSDVTSFGIFMRLSAPPARGPIGPAQIRGAALFDTVGCTACHSPTLKTAASPFTGMSNVIFHPYSDFALHHMGATLADGIVQGVAGADEFRSAPLWGIGQRLFFLHDGRTQDLLEAIYAHASPADGTCSKTLFDSQFSINGQGDPPPRGTAQGAQDVQMTQEWCTGSEANTVIQDFNALSPEQQQDVLYFLRSL